MKKIKILSVIVTVLMLFSSCSDNSVDVTSTEAESTVTLSDVSIIASESAEAIITTVSETRSTSESETFIETTEPSVDTTEFFQSEIPVEDKTVSTTVLTTVEFIEETETQTQKETATEATTSEATKITTSRTEITTTIPLITTEEVTENTKMEIVEKKYIALTFDDGPNTTTTNEVLDILEEYGIKASFFLIGNNINNSSSEVVKRAYDMGCDIGNHSKAHLYMDKLSVDEIVDEIEFVNEKIVEITGEEPKFFRPPYIAVNDTMYDNIDLTFIAGFGCNDWEERVTAERRAKSVIKQAKDGGIILLHDSQGNSKTVEALRTIIPELQAQGYEFVTLSRLFEIKGVKISPVDTNLYSFVG